MTDSKPLISVVVPHLNQPDALDTCLRSLDTQSLARCFFEIIVVDNGSVSAPEHIVAKHPGTRLLCELQPGPGPARNRGVRHATGDIVAFIDADCRAHHDWLLYALRAIDTAAPGTILGGDVRIWRDDLNTFTAIAAYEELFAYRFKMFIERHGYSGTGNMVVRRLDYEKAGPFGGIEVAEDIEWGQRARSVGLRFCYVPEMLVFHPARRSLHELCVKWDRHTQHAFNMICGSPAWKLRWIVRALAVMASPAVDSIRVLTSNRIQGLPNRIKAIGVLFAIRLYRSGRMLTLLNASNTVVWNRDAVEATHLGPEPVRESGTP
jgi:glycosyltransferase involved in cell wall biosynthesis